jgi:hypothetical protein
MRTLKKMIRSVSLRPALKLGTGLIALLGLVSVAHAGEGWGVVPEIDPGSAVSAITLLAGSVLLLTGKCRRQ